MATVTESMADTRGVQVWGTVRDVCTGGEASAEGAWGQGLAGVGGTWGGGDLTETLNFVSLFAGKGEEVGGNL